MRARLVTLLLLAAAVLYPAPTAAQADPTRADLWRAVAQRAYDRYQVLDTGPQIAHTLAYAAQSTAWLSPNGWDDPAAAAYLTRLYATANPDGGYGLGVTYDWAGDGTANPADTTYTVTLAGHVGPVLLDGYRAGVVPRAKVQAVFDLLVTTPRIDTSAGRCFAYSRNVGDAKPGLCSHNVSDGAAAFLMEAARDGFAAPWWLVQGVVKRSMSAYNQNSRAWPYRDNTAPTLQDDAHNAYSIESAYSLAYPVGYTAAVVAMWDPPDDSTSALGYALLAGLPPTPTAMSGDTTLWCVLGDARRADVDAWTTAHFSEPRSLIQVAYYAARAARACEIGAP